MSTRDIRTSCDGLGRCCREELCQQRRQSMSAPEGQGAEGRFWKQGGIARRQGDFHDSNADATFGRLILWRTEVYPPTTEIHMYQHLGPVVGGSCSVVTQALEVMQRLLGCVRLVIAAAPVLMHRACRGLATRLEVCHTITSSPRRYGISRRKGLGGFLRPDLIPLAAYMGRAYGPGWLGWVQGSAVAVRCGSAAGSLWLWLSLALHWLCSGLARVCQPATIRGFGQCCYSHLR